jgi:hypothetical protein
VSNSYSTGSVIGLSWVGGLVGDNSGTVDSCYSTGSVTGSSDVGGLAGLNGGTVTNSHYNYDEVLINGKSIITVGALFTEDFEQWLADDKSLSVSGRLAQEDDYYVIDDIGDFKELLAFGQDDSLKFRLTNDLDLGDEPNFYIPYLAGEFDGNGHKIWNLSFNFGFVSSVGLFGYLGSGAKVSRLSVENVNIIGDRQVGGLVGGSAGTVTNSHAGGSVSGRLHVGGLMGVNDGGTVNDTYSAGSVGGGSSVGGLVGWNVWGSISSCYSICNVKGESSIGGLVGEDYGSVSNSHSTGSVTGQSAVGGLVGNSHEGTVSNCYSTGGVAGQWEVGGLVGYGTGTVNHSFWDTQTSGQATSEGGTGKTTAEMKSINTFSGAGWNMIAVANPDSRNPSYIWNIVDGQTYPFLSWES